MCFCAKWIKFVNGFIHWNEGKMNFWVKKKRMNEELKIEFTLNVKFFIFSYPQKSLLLKLLSSLS